MEIQQKKLIIEMIEIRTLSQDKEASARSESAVIQPKFSI